MPLKITKLANYFEKKYLTSFSSREEAEPEPVHIKTYIKTNNLEEAPSGRVYISTRNRPVRYDYLFGNPYETFVFQALPDQNDVVSFTQLDHNGYENFEDAERGHEEMVKKWSQ
jgi:hypothetical protein